MPYELDLDDEELTFLRSLPRVGEWEIVRPDPDRQRACALAAIGRRLGSLGLVKFCWQHAWAHYDNFDRLAEECHAQDAEELVERVGFSAQITERGDNVRKRAVGQQSLAPAKPEEQPHKMEGRDCVSEESSLDSFVHDLNQFTLAEPTTAGPLASSVLSGLNVANAEALEVGDNNGTGEANGGDVDRTFRAVAERVPKLSNAGFVEKNASIGEELSRIAQWNDLRNRLLQIRRFAEDRTVGKQVLRYVEWCTALLGAFRVATNFFPADRTGHGWVERKERCVFHSEVSPSYIPDWHDRPYGRAIAEVSEPGLRGFALPKLERLSNALEAAAQKVRRAPQGLFFGTPEGLELSAAISECLPLTASQAASEAPLKANSDPEWITCSNSFRSVRCVTTAGKTVAFSFTVARASFFKVLWENYQRGLYDVTKEDLLDAVFAKSVRCSDRVDVLFREKGGGYHPAWKTLIVAGGSKGTYRLADRDAFEAAWAARSKVSAKKIPKKKILKNRKAHRKPRA